MRLLDLFCGAGGAATGYHRAGFEVVGIDHVSQPDYPFTFYQDDALEFVRQWMTWPYDEGSGYDSDYFDAIHASPPCQAYSSLRRLGKGAGVGAVDLVGQTRELLNATGLPYVIENVPGAPLHEPVQLCGSGFGLKVRRHRLFETNFPLMSPGCAHGRETETIAVYGDHPQDPSGRSPRRARTLAEGQVAMGIDWMPWEQLTQAIPPAYTEHIGHYLMAEVNAAQAA